MPPLSSSPSSSSVAPLCARDVVRFLNANPDFLIAHPDLLLTLNLPERTKQAGGIVDFQGARITRLKEEMSLLQKERDLVIARSHHNKLTQDRIHRATLHVVQASDSAGLMTCLRDDLPEILGLDVVILASEHPASEPCLTSLPLGTINRLTDGQVLSLHSNIAASPLLYGAQATQIKSQALVRLSQSCGLLAFGACQSDFFHPAQGTELLRFLSAVIESTLKRWRHQ